MEREDIEQRLEALLDQLATIEHERWSHWQRYLHGKCIPQQDGSLLMPAELARRWAKQSSTPYSDLSVTEKESDREQVRKYLPLIIRKLSDRKP